MAKRSLNDRIIKTLKPAESGQRYEVRDAVTPGLVVRVTDRGTKSFALVARYPGSTNPTRRALGEYGAVGLAEARAKARHWIELVAKGIDPQAEIERQRLAEQRKRVTTFAAVAEDFIKDKLPGERRGKEVERDIRRDLITAWGDRPVTEITAFDVRAVIKVVAARGPYQAHNLLGYARRLFEWAIDQHAYGLEASPCDRLKPRAIIGEKRARTRTLTDDEVRAFWRVTGRMAYPYGAIGRMLLLTGQRHREVAGARWREIDLATKLWTVGEERFKSEAPNMVPLSDMACELLADLPRFRIGDYVFSAGNGERPTTIHNRMKHDLDARMLRTLKAMARMRGEDPARVELRPWVIHDLRRVVRSHLAALRIPDHVAEKCLGHGRRGLQRVYDQHQYSTEMREALTLWAARLRDIVAPPPPNVVKLRSA